MGDVRGPHVAHLERETEAGAPPPSLSTSLGARVPGAPARGIFTLRSPLKRARDLPWEPSYREKAYHSLVTLVKDPKTPY